MKSCQNNCKKISVKSKIKAANSPINRTNLNEYKIMMRPPNHIESQSQITFPQQSNMISSSFKSDEKKRRRKIFERKILKATIMPLEEKRTNSPTKNISINKSSNQQIGIKSNLNFQQNEYLSRIKQLQLQKCREAVKFPSFVKNQHPNNYQIIKQQQLVPINMTINMTQQLGNLSCQILKIKQQVLQQKKYINNIQEKLNKKSQQNIQKENKLLTLLINKQEQLIRRQQINFLQQSKGRIQLQMTRNGLQMEREKRIHNLSFQIQRLHYQITRNESKQSYDVTPFSHPVNNNFFIDQYNEKSISALKNFNHQNQDCYSEYDNTLRDLLSPLEIKPENMY